MRRMFSEKQVKNLAQEAVLEIEDYTDTVKYLNGYSNKNAFIKIYKQNNELKIVVSGEFNIDQNEFTVGAVQTPISFELPEEVSRKLYKGDSNTAQGNICKISAIYYNDITYVTSVCVGFLRRVSNGGNIYWIRFGNNELTAASTSTSYDFRLTLAL